MHIPPSENFTPVPLDQVFNADRAKLETALQLNQTETYFGAQSFQGIAFSLGTAGQPNVLLLDKEEVHIEVDNIQATYMLFLHAVEDRITNYSDELANFAVDGNELGQTVSDYTLEFADGSSATAPILRRFAIQQSHISWGASPFAAMPDAKHSINASATEEQALGRASREQYGHGETRVRSGRDYNPEKLWIYALPNPEPDKPIRRITCTPREERSLIYAVSHTRLDEHPLRPGVRRKLRLQLPEGARLNTLGELEEIDIDLGHVISARTALDYDRDHWLGAEPNVQPTRAENAVVVEYSAHPQARLYVGTGADSPVGYDLANLAEPALASIAPAHRPVHLRVVEKGSQQLVAVRLHLHGQGGEYLPPKGYHRKVNPYWFEDNYGEFVNGLNQYCYIPGECVADLPLGEVFVEISRGYEVAPIRTTIEIKPDTDELEFELERVLHWRRDGWVTADTHVHFLTPQTARLEGEAEGINVVNLLASQWGEMFSNVSDFDGRTTLGAREFGGDGEFLVRVGTENRMQVLGHISLLGYSGAMIHPLCSGGPSESALGDPQELSMAEWAQRCIDQGGLVVMPHGPNPQCERAADIVLGLVHAIEMMTFNPCNAQINPYGIADWYRFLNLGYQIPVVGGTDKMSAASQLGGIRTYTQMGDREFTYDNWMAAVQQGNTFVTVGPLVELQVEGQPPGSTLDLPAGGGSVNISWKVESVSLPIDQVEVVVGGLAAEQVNIDKQLCAAGSAEIAIAESTWIALRVRGSYQGKHGEIAAHSSAVQVRVGNKPLYSQRDATAILEQIEGAIAYVDTLAPPPRGAALQTAQGHSGGGPQPAAPAHAPARRLPPARALARSQSPTRTLRDYRKTDLKRRNTMPLITVKMLDGRTQEQKRELVKAITDAMVEICGAKPEGTSVVIEEVTREHWAVGGVLVADR